MKIIAALLEQAVIEKILTNLDLQARAPPRASTRGQALQVALALSRPRRFIGPAVRATGTGFDRDFQDRGKAA